VIITIVGDVGGSKTLTAIREIKRRNRVAFTNFDCSLPNVIRLKKDDILQEYVREDNKKDYKVNWDFWNNAREKFKSFDIYIDEIAGIFSGRSAMTRYSIVGMSWIQQIRKIFGNSKQSNIYLICQRIERLDIAWRDLTQKVILCTKIEKGEKVISLQYHFNSDTSLSASQKFEYFKMGTKCYNRRLAFVGNSYFKYYDTYQFLGGDTEWL
jgi:hypothetical protein